MKFPIHSLFAAIALYSTTCSASLPLVDSESGTIQERPYCPSRPASPSFQRAAFYQFINELYEQKQIESTFAAFVSEDYIQHNSYILSGRDNTVKAIGPGGVNDFSKTNFTIYQIIFDSPFGVIHSKVETPGQSVTAITDLWRFNGTCIVEHWDTIQSLPSDAINPKALF